MYAFILSGVREEIKKKDNVDARHICIIKCNVGEFHTLFPVPYDTQAVLPQEQMRQPPPSRAADVTSTVISSGDKN
jgi:hypothetical protein